MFQQEQMIVVRSGEQLMLKRERILVADPTEPANPKYRSGGE